MRLLREEAGTRSSYAIYGSLRIFNNLIQQPYSYLFMLEASSANCDNFVEWNQNANWWDVLVITWYINYWEERPCICDMNTPTARHLKLVHNTIMHKLMYLMVRDNCVY